MKKYLYIALLILQLTPIKVYANQDEFCAGFKQGFGSVKGNLVIPPICPIFTIPPIGISYFQIGITKGITAAGAFQRNNPSPSSTNSKYAISDDALGNNLKSMRGFRDRIDYLWPAIQSGRITTASVSINFNPPNKAENPQFIADLLEVNEQWMRESENDKKIFLVIYNPTNISVSNLGLTLYKDGRCGKDGALIYKIIYLQLTEPLYPTKIIAYSFNTTFDETFGYSNSCIVISKTW